MPFTIRCDNHQLCPRPSRVPVEDAGLHDDGRAGHSIAAHSWRRMSVAQRKAVGERMGKYWAERRRATHKPLPTPARTGEGHRLHAGC